jgi:N-methylhydantoinase A
VPALRLDDAAEAGHARKGERPAWFGTSGFVPTPVYDRYRLAPGVPLHGPAIVEERESTTIVPPGVRATVEPGGAVRLDLG